MMRIKTGPPIIAVIIPVSSSPGRPSIRPSTSDINNIEAPYMPLRVIRCK